MKKTLKGFILGIIAAIIGMVIFTNIGITPNVSKPDSVFTMAKINSAMNIIRRSYMGEIDEQKMSDYMFLGLVAGLEDEFSGYYTKEEYEQISEMQQGHYTGIGINVAQEQKEGRIIILSVIPEGPAEKAGVLAEDEVTAVNGEKVEGRTTTEVTEAILKSESNTVQLDIYRPSTEEELSFTIEKAEMDTFSVYSGMIDDSIGYIQITSFTGVTANQFSEALDQLREKGMEKLIVDLRGNTGGLVSGVCDTLSYVLPEGVIFYNSDKLGHTTEKRCDGKNELEVPLVVLVNDMTASASEIFSGAVQDYGKGEIIGTQTYGKGIVQDVYRLSDQSVIKITVSHYYTPDKNDIHKKGITPDIVVEDDEDTPEDEQLEYAIDYFK